MPGLGVASVLRLSDSLGTGCLSKAAAQPPPPHWPQRVRRATRAQGWKLTTLDAEGIVHQAFVHNLRAEGCDVIHICEESTPAGGLLQGSLWKALQPQGDPPNLSLSCPPGTFLPGTRCVHLPKSPRSFEPLANTAPAQPRQGCLLLQPAGARPSWDGQPVSPWALARHRPAAPSPPCSPSPPAPQLICLPLGTGQEAGLGGRGAGWEGAVLPNAPT